MKRARPEWEIIFSTQSFPTLTLWFSLQESIRSIFNFIECCRSDFRSASIMRLKTTLYMFMPFWICDEIPFGFGTSCGREDRLLPLSVNVEVTSYDPVTIKGK